MKVIMSNEIYVLLLVTQSLQAPLDDHGIPGSYIILLSVYQSNPSKISQPRDIASFPERRPLTYLDLVCGVDCLRHSLISGNFPTGKSSLSLQRYISLHPRHDLNASCSSLLVLISLSLSTTHPNHGARKAYTAPVRKPEWPIQVNGEPDRRISIPFTKG